jgi:2-polyprenyl-6-methoxyphenol hydroxylase-like FAD-dependent oxidoreductase
MQAHASELLRDGDRVVGVLATTPGEPLEVRAELVVGADGRHSVVRERAELPVRDLGAPIDVLWMRVPRLPSDGDQVFGIFTRSKFLVMLNRDDYWQCAYLIEKGGLDALKQRGLAALHGDLRSLAPSLGDRAASIASWDDVKLLAVKVDHLARWWQPGLLCIGDAAHAMSPVGGVGINLAIQDAVAAANRLARPLRDGALGTDDLAAVQARRGPAARRIQRLQIQLHERVLAKVLAGRGERTLRVVRFFLRHLAFLRRFMGRTIGVGRFEHVALPAADVPPPARPGPVATRPHPS